jgi:hypothetical protein
LNVKVRTVGDHPEAAHRKVAVEAGHPGGGVHEVYGGAY